VPSVDGGGGGGGTDCTCQESDTGKLWRPFRVAFTANAWVATVRPEYAAGELHGPKAALSREQRYALPAVGEAKENDAVVAVVGFAGPFVMVGAAGGDEGGGGGGPSAAVTSADAPDVDVALPPSLTAVTDDRTVDPTSVAPIA
jgi:hypothetical protein